MIKNRLSKELIMYLIMGVLTTVVNIVVFYALTLFHLDYKIATVIAWLISVLFAYITNKKYVFASNVVGLAANLREMCSFFFFRLLSLGIDLGVMLVMVGMLGLNELFSKIIDNVFVIIFNYIASKLVIFKKSA